MRSKRGTPNFSRPLCTYITLRRYSYVITKQKRIVEHFYLSKHLTIISEQKNNIMFAHLLFFGPIRRIRKNDLQFLFNNLHTLICRYKAWDIMPGCTALVYTFPSFADLKIIDFKVDVYIFSKFDQTLNEISVLNKAFDNVLKTVELPASRVANIANILKRALLHLFFP